MINNFLECQNDGIHVIFRYITSQTDPYRAMGDLVGRPMARSTWEGSKEAEEQAEPLETQMPLASSFSKMDSPSMASKVNEAMDGRRFTGSPVRRVRGNFKTSWISLSRSMEIRGISSSKTAHRSFKAAASPTAPATFSVPERRFRS